MDTDSSKPASEPASKRVRVLDRIDLKRLVYTEPDPLKEFRCAKCHALLFKGRLDGEIKCRKCGRLVRLKAVG